MVENFYLAQDADIRRIEVCGQDEDARPVTFREWLIRFAWERPDYLCRCEDFYGGLCPAHGKVHPDTMAGWISADL